MTTQANVSSARSEVDRITKQKMQIEASSASGRIALHSAIDSVGTLDVQVGLIAASYASTPERTSSYLQILDQQEIAEATVRKLEQDLLEVRTERQHIS